MIYQQNCQAFQPKNEVMMLDINLIVSKSLQEASKWSYNVITHANNNQIINLINSSMGHKQSSPKINRIHFKENTNPQILIDKEQKLILKTLLQNDKWILDNGKCKQFRFQSILSQVKQVNITVLNLNANNIETLPSILPQIYFPSLQSLKLCGNNISSIESFAFLKAEKLIQLWISWNNLTESRSLRKCNFPKLRYLSLERNYLPNLGKDLAACNFPQLRQISIEEEKKTISTCDNIQSSCLKWQSSKLYQIVCISSSRITCSSRVWQMREKYLSLKWYREQKKDNKEVHNVL